MPYRKKSWREKLEDDKQFPKILPFDPKFPCGKALKKMGAKPGDTVVLAPPRDVAAVMKEVPKGRVITLKEICKNLAAKHNVQYCCTLTTGIFILTAAHTEEEAKEQGESLHIPYWRTLKIGGLLNSKFPGGAEQQKALLEKEGLSIFQKGSQFYVDNFTKYLIG
jgi:alkylated DNA nucleotide flippase Atl1